MNYEELDLLSREQLIELILVQIEQLKQVAQLQADFTQLKLDNEALKVKFEQNQKPPTSSKNSSQPPSRDQKSNTAKDKTRHRHGPPQGHEKHEREFVVHADHVVDLRVKACHGCQADLQGVDGRLVKVNQITELPD